MNTAGKAVMAAAIAGRRVGIGVGAFSGVAIIAIAVVHLVAPRLPLAAAECVAGTDAGLLL